MRHIVMIHPLSRLAAGLLVLSVVTSAAAERVKDIADLAGVRDNQLVGYGIVVGLNGSGDSQQSKFTVQSIVGMLSRMGIRVDPKSLRTKNAAAVMITAKLPAFATSGTSIDVVVSSMGDAKSLRGGTLLMAPLMAVDHNVYAMAQGPLTVGGFSAGGAGSKVTKNHPTVGRIPGGGTIERELLVTLTGRPQLIYQLKRPDFTTAARMAAAITATGVKAKALDARRVAVEVPEDKRQAPVALIASIESAEVQTDMAARIVLNARTGTVVMGANVRLGPVALAHGGLRVEIQTQNGVSQPTSFGSGNTARVQNAEVRAREGRGAVKLLKATANLGQLVEALNLLGVSPRDLIDILQAMKSAGAIQADIEVQ